jgi:hypothetical protein
LALDRQFFDLLFKIKKIKNIWNFLWSRETWTYKDSSPLNRSKDGKKVKRKNDIFFKTEAQMERNSTERVTFSWKQKHRWKRCRKRMTHIIWQIMWRRAIMKNWNKTRLFKVSQRLHTFDIQSEICHLRNNFQELWISITKYFKKIIKIYIVINLAVVNKTVVNIEGQYFPYVCFSRS